MSQSSDRNWEPTAYELLAELKNTAWTCASINAAVCASYPPKLYIATANSASPKHSHSFSLSPSPNQRGRPETHNTKALPLPLQERLRAAPHLHPRIKGAERIQEVVDHPLLTLLRSVNPVHNAFDLWEVTQLYLEVFGSAFWLLEMNPELDIPEQIWILPSQYVRVVRQAGSGQLVDYYEFRGAAGPVRYGPEQIIHFRCPDPRDPYNSGFSPLRACYEQAVLSSEHAALRRSVYDNTGVPSVVVTASDSIGEEERTRLEKQWNEKFRRGGNGGVLISQNDLKVSVVSRSMGDLAALADLKATKEDIANTFGVPLPFLTGETNLANMQAADHLHKSLAIRPRLIRRDEKLNEQLIPLYDPTGRLFLAADDPVPAEREAVLKERELLLKYGVVTVNEVRSEMGLAPVAWGESPVSGVRSRESGKL